MSDKPDECLDEALDYFAGRMRARPDVCEAVAYLKGGLYGYPDGRWSEALLSIVSDFLDGLSWTVEQYDGDNDLFVVADYIYARDHKIAIIGKELAPYV
jgi:hypothetical protein